VLIKRCMSKWEEEFAKMWLEADDYVKLRRPCSLGLSANSQQYFSLRTNQPPATSRQYFSLRTNRHQPLATSQTNRLVISPCLLGSALLYDKKRQFAKVSSKRGRGDLPHFLDQHYVARIGYVAAKWSGKYACQSWVLVISRKKS
jgi:hypothetical protein